MISVYFNFFNSIWNLFLFSKMEIQKTDSKAVQNSILEKVDYLYTIS